MNWVIIHYALSTTTMQHFSNKLITYYYDTGVDRNMYACPSCIYVFVRVKLVSIKATRI